jgi:MFS family permease
MLQEKNQRIATILAFALLPLSGFATDIYIPSLPGMGVDMHISNTQVQLTLSVFLISYGFSQFFIGSVLDSFGRYRLGLYALIIFALASIIIAVTHNIYLIYLMRVIHGITVAVIVVAKRAFFVDLYKGDRLKHYLSLFTIIWFAGPILAPFIGGYLQKNYGWQSNFYFLAGFAILIAILEIVFSGETLLHKTNFKIKEVIEVYLKMLKTANFTLGLLMLSFAYSMVMVYNMTGPFIIEHQLHLTPVIVGYCSLILGLAWMVGGFIGKATINRPFYKKLLANSSLQILVIALMIISLSYFSNLYSLVFFAFIIHVTAGFTYNNYFTYCLSQFPKNAGIAGGLTGGVVYVLLSFLTYGIVEVIPAKDEQELSYSYLILILLSAIGMVAILYQTNKQSKLLFR